MTVLDLTPLRIALAPLIPQGRSALLPALHQAQNIYGHIPEPIATEVARLLHVPLADVDGVIEFYALFYKQPVGRSVVRVCVDPLCALRGADAVLAAACQKAGVAPHQTSADGAYTVEPSPCLGLCNRPVGVNVVEGGKINVLTAEDASYPEDAGGREVHDFVSREVAVMTPLCGRGRAASLREYEAAGGMKALQAVVGGLRAPAQVLDAIKQSGLVGCGGAAFPTGLKWEGAARATGSPKYFVVNADESEPGTFKDRVLLEGDPLRVLEGLILGAYAIGANKAYFYIRGEYPIAQARVQTAIDECYLSGYLGQNILRSGYDLEVELRSGAGAYICGEETALFESIEGKRGFPRVKPPFPTTHGLFGKPTVINNVETLAKVPYILANGPAAFRQWGTEKSPGPKLFCISGDVARPGVFEVPFGITLRHLVEDLAGGVVGELQAILMGGAAGAWAVEKDLDVRLTFEDLRAAGLPLGSGAVMVFNRERDLRDVLRRLAKFFAHESCGKCYPCQLGTQRQLEVLNRVAASRPLAGDIERLSDVGWTMTDASLCGLGQTAASAVLSALRLWPEMFEASNA